jgi:hypothetical protein
MASELYVETLKGLTSGANANKVIIPSGQTLDIAGDWTPPAGTVLQVVNTVKTDYFTTTSSSFTDITGLSASITPSSTSNKVLVLANISFGVSTGVGFVALWDGGAYIHQGTSGVAQNGMGASGGYEPSYWWPHSHGASVLLSPNSTNTLTITGRALARGSVGTVRINGRGFDSDYGVASSITLMEIAG